MATRKKKTTNTPSSSIKTEALAKVDDGRAGSNQPPFKARRFSVQLDFDWIYKGKKMDDTKNVVPDLALTVRQLLANHTRGVSGGEVKIQREQYFEGPVPVITDLTDVDRWIEALDKQAEKARQFLKDNPPEKFSNEDGPIITDRQSVKNVEDNGQTRIPDA